MRLKAVPPRPSEILYSISGCYQEFLLVNLQQRRPFGRFDQPPFGYILCDSMHYVDIHSHLDLPSFMMERRENNRKNAESRTDAKKQFPIRSALVEI
jgi:hypothetical protein